MAILPLFDGSAIDCRPALLSRLVVGAMNAMTIIIAPPPTPCDASDRGNVWCGSATRSYLSEKYLRSGGCCPFFAGISRPSAPIMSFSEPMRTCWLPARPVAPNSLADISWSPHGR
jgi:hypothetical protein